MHRRSALLSLSLVGSLAIYGCAQDSASPTEAGLPGSSSARMAAASASSADHDPIADDPIAEARGRAPKVDICHIDDAGAWELINVNGNAQQAHVGHGDGLPGGDVPGQAGYAFDDSCTPVATAVCPCFDAQQVSEIVAYGAQCDSPFGADSFRLYAADSVGNNLEALVAPALSNFCTLRDIPGVIWDANTVVRSLNNTAAEASACQAILAATAECSAL